MTLLNVTFDTQTLAAAGLKRFLQKGQILRAVGILNVRWEDFSALDVAREAGLSGVVWESISDDTSGTLELIVWYPHSQGETIRQQVARLKGVEDFEVWEGLQGSTEI